MRAPATWDIFCRVVDNFGDAAVCWRLARELALEHGCAVRLYIDDLETLWRLDPAVAAAERQIVDGVEIRGLDASFDMPLPDVVIDAFGCSLPAAYVAAMAGASRPPLWIVLEYLSAEPWVRDHHGLPSPHPHHALERYFFFPGFERGTGGLLREADLLSRRDRFGAVDRASFWRAFGHMPPDPAAVVVSLFAYDGAPLADLLDGWQRGPQAVVAAITESALSRSALAHLGAHGRIVQRGTLELRVLPFVTQRQYDELLWCCDVNFVRGEDSFVRAQWAARPLVWNVYPQADRTHERKLDAFLDTYGKTLPADAGRAVARLMHAWNQTSAGGVTPASAWPEFIAHRAAFEQHAIEWAGHLAAAGELAANLAEFCRDKLK